MSSAVADTTEAEAPAPKKSFGKKKLIMMLALALLVVAVGGGAAVFFIKKRQARLAEEAGEGDSPAAAQADPHALQKRDLKHPPAYVPLDMFTVNLADKDADRYAQIGVTLEMEDAHAADEVKGYMPAIRSNILLVLSRKTAADLLAPEGKKQLAYEIKREALRALGIDYQEEAPVAAKPTAKGASAAKKKPKAPEDPLPIRDVFFSNFIIQ
jgi:flagellar FliL protein